MSASAALQKAVHDALVADAGVGALVGDRIYDGAPSTAVFPYLEFGPSDFVPDIAECVTTRIETLQIDCWARNQGRKRICAEIVDAVHAALHQRDLTLSAPYRVLWIEATGRTTPDPDGITWHGIVTVEAEVQTHGAGA
ncbi:DUF3168 domain-containing protein [Roseivivax isoporae]|uniref:Gene transfer agent protein n=1 Tax=Roseivivax isoporae LMG 25204 TaxID=1449351 RepID=X7F3J1_9RHOB|nr:DUF3168 domain-containing protein [Roseivivax isoporae]ETX26604.1 hypothetical protein RISW2_21800 [Roseivivax isoporae LMG 25204]